MSSLADGFDAVVCDLDGVVYAGPAAIDHAVDTLNAMSVPVVFATNNASRTPDEVTAHLQSLGITTSAERVLTSALAAAHELASTVPPGSPVLAIGGDGVGASLRSVGLEPRMPGESDEVIAVVQGYGTEVTVADLSEAAFAIQAGARWIATNDDLTLPTERGFAPGNGTLVAAVRQAVDVDPVVIGKPHPPMYILAAQLVRAKAGRVLAVGDRLETDIAGAVAAGMPGALVLTGVHGPDDAAGAPPEQRPSFLLADLRDLTRPYPPPEDDHGWSRRGEARARLGRTGTLDIEGEGMDATRAALDALWTGADEGRISPGDARRLMANR